MNVTSKREYCAGPVVFLVPSMSFPSNMGDTWVYTWGDMGLDMLSSRWELRS